MNSMLFSSLAAAFFAFGSCSVALLATIGFSFLTLAALFAFLTNAFFFLAAPFAFTLSFTLSVTLLGADSEG